MILCNEQRPGGTVRKVFHRPRGLEPSLPRVVANPTAQRQRRVEVVEVPPALGYAGPYSGYQSLRAPAVG